MAAQPLSPLPDELVESIILLRIPPDDPRGLIRAAVTCKHWHRVVSSPSFRRGFRDLHRTPPMLGVLRNYLVRGIPTVMFCPVYTFREYHQHDWRAIDSRHGRVLLHRKGSMGFGHMLAVWNPVAGEQRILPDLLPFETPWSNFNAAVLCAGGGGCDHIDCRRNGPFRVVFMMTNREKMASYIYSSETNAWTESISPFLGKFCISSRGAFVEKENSLYFVLETTPRILFYNLSTLELTVIDSPPMMNDRAWPMRNDRLALMTGEGGGLGCATVDGSNINSQLYLSARNVDPDGH
ncbi:hypothetical protein HU200_015976 [Digitaria exilis]|uniref:F-box domain-containing protein n=1 Tax=Digitaria exilis TaxID=1010633 RepID=A0A835F8N7_9POAL|nr:hypothetical protein HU200_015976 [Digitaria exilis]